MVFGRKRLRLDNVLIVEDEPLIAFDNERFLGDEGYAVVATLDNAAAARALIEAGAPIDLIIADISLADGSGIDVARAAAARGIRVLFASGQCPAEASGFADGCLAKPYQQRDLLAAIAVIERRAAGEAPGRLPAGLTLFDRAR